MQSTHQEAYRSFAAKAPDLPLFMQPWYLDVVCEGGAWDAVLIEVSGKKVAALPFFLKHKWAWNYVTMPQLCKQLGPYLLPEYRTLKWEMRLYAALIEKLPATLAAFEQNFNYTVTNWLPFYWEGFKQTTLYSYILPLGPSEDEIFQQIEKNYRKKIQAAQAKLLVRHDLPLQEMYRLMATSFKRQGLKMPISFSFLERFYKALDEKASCKLFFAQDPDTQLVHSASMLVWDQQSAYYLLSGDDPALRSSGAGILLQWAAIQYTKTVVGLPVFDFEGSMMRSIEQGRRDFGAQQLPYFRVRKEWSALWKWGKLLRQ